MRVPMLKLNSGYDIPQIGLGTWLGQPGEMGEAVRTAIDVGYRHIDCAMAYSNQKEIGSGLADVFKNTSVKRSELFVTSKIWNTFHSFRNATKAIDIILDELQLDYLDLCLIHWPMGYLEDAEMFPFRPDGSMQHSDIDYLDTWRALEAAVSNGKIKSIGISNFNLKQIQRIIDESTVKPAMLQTEIHPYLVENELISFCKNNGITVTAYSPLANPSHKFRKPGQPNLLDEPILRDISQTHHKSTAQVAIRWSLQRGLVVIPKSVKRERLVDNINVFDFTLSDAEMTAISSLNIPWRITDISARDGRHPHFPFN